MSSPSANNGLGCGKRRVPGKGQPGCAFRGAKMALQPITDAAHLVHGPASCEAGSWAFRPVASSGSLLHRYSFTTDVGEMDLIRGGEVKLLAALREVIERYGPPAIFVYETCLPAMTGDHIVAVCREASARWPRPVIPVCAAGLAGSRPYGGHVAAKALLNHVIGGREPDQPTSTDIVLIGEFNLAGEIDSIRRLLSRLGKSASLPASPATGGSRTSPRRIGRRLRSCSARRGSTVWPRGFSNGSASLSSRAVFMGPPVRRICCNGCLRCWPAGALQRICRSGPASSSENKRRLSPARWLATAPRSRESGPCFCAAALSPGRSPPPYATPA